MAGEMVAAWVDELTKLGEKARAKSSQFEKSKGVANASTHPKKNGDLAKKLEEPSTSCSFQEIEAAPLSESTMCLLLDRFVPC